MFTVAVEPIWGNGDMTGSLHSLLLNGTYLVTILLILAAIAGLFCIIVPFKTTRFRTRTHVVLWVILGAVGAPTIFFLGSGAALVLAPKYPTGSADGSHAENVCGNYFKEQFDCLSIKYKESKRNVFSKLDNRSENYLIIGVCSKYNGSDAISSSTEVQVLVEKCRYQVSCLVSDDHVVEHDVLKPISWPGGVDCRTGKEIEGAIPLDWNVKPN